MPAFLACVLALLVLVALAVGGAVLMPEGVAGMGGFDLLLASEVGFGFAAFASWLALLLAGAALRVSLGMVGIALMVGGFLIGVALLLAIGLATLPLLLPLLLLAVLAWSLRRVLGADALNRAPALPGSTG